MKHFCLALLFVVFASFTIPEDKKITVYMVGDSTMCLYDFSRYPQEGWGMPFARFFDSSVKVDNRARGGRSSKSFIAEGLWKSVTDNLSEGDYVLIQFGHNDPANSADHPDRMVNPEEFARYLGQYVDEARAKKAIPVLISPVAKRKFDKDGKAMEAHGEYAKKVLEVAKAKKAILIDLEQKSRALIQKLGPESSKYLFMDFEPGELPNFPRGIHDVQHFNNYGARRIAELVLGEIRVAAPELAKHIVKPGASQ